MRLSTLLHTHVALILVSTMAALDAAFVIGQIICDILIMKESLSEWEHLDVNLTALLLKELPYLNSTYQGGHFGLKKVHDVLLAHNGSSALFGTAPAGLAGNPPTDFGIDPRLWQALQAAAVSLPVSQLSGIFNVSVPGAADSNSSELVVTFFKIPVGRSKRAAGPSTRAAPEGSVVEGHEMLHHLTHSFHLGSMIILSILLAEALLKVFAMGKKVLHHKLEIFDAFVVTVSWALDVAFYEGIWAHPGSEAATILIFILPWRVVRIVNSFILVIQEKDHVQLKIVKHRLRMSVKKSKESVRKASSYRTEVKQLQGLCRKYGATENEIHACDPTGRHGRRRSSLMPAMERVASLTLISALGSHPSLYTMDSSSDDEREPGSRTVRRLASDNPTLRSALSVSTLDSVFTIESKGEFDSESVDGVDNPVFLTSGDEDTPPSSDSPLNAARLPHDGERDLGRVQLSRRLHARLLQQDSNASGLSQASLTSGSSGPADHSGGEDILPQYHEAVARQDSNTRL